MLELFHFYCTIHGTNQYQENYNTGEINYNYCNDGENCPRKFSCNFYHHDEEYENWAKNKKLLQNWAKNKTSFANRFNRK